MNAKFDDAIDEELRNRLYKSVHEEFVGPMDPDSEEILDERDSPAGRYHAGVLHPRGAHVDVAQGESAGREADTVLDERNEGPARDGGSPDIADASDVGEALPDEDYEEPVALSNARAQSAISMTVAVRPGDVLSADIRCAKYVRIKVDDKSHFKRVPVHFVFKSGDLAIPSGRHDDVKRVYRLGKEHLELWLVYRRAISGGVVLTVAVCNTDNATGNRSDDDLKCYYQTYLRISSSSGLIPPVWNQANDVASAEDATKRLIYRNIRNYAIGHGCATRWDDNRPVLWAETQIIPTAETRSMKPIHPSMENVTLSIEDFGNPDHWENTLGSMRLLCKKYGQWIFEITAESEGLSECYQTAAQDNLSQCEACLNRIKEGISVLETDPIARKAFIMANEAMYEQFLHYSVVSGERGGLDEPLGYTRSWRPFQLAFILMNIRSMVDETCEDRKVVDLIWFPTGGGKTEAYLGLSAFVLIWERLSHNESKGVTVFMRYTLRLLTSQQFDRASSLICSLEAMRRRESELLGSREFRIGLWVGKDASPNNRHDAKEKRLTYVDKEEGLNPFPVRKCPWCGSSFEDDRRASYVRQRGTEKLLFVCPNPECEYSKGDGLPLDVVDEEIYQNPPSLLVGTIDKFAMLPYRHEAFALFGIDNGRRGRPPKRIIQDELHLISGPLGSMAGHYETLVSALCERTDASSKILPKIVASTATVSRAKEQCNQLYACGEDKVFQFPPSGIDYDDSFFSYEDKEARGRRYAGLFIPTLNAASANIRLYADLLWEPATWNDVTDEQKDPYWTIVGYYGTTRELGQAVTWMGGDIPERLHEHKKRAERVGDKSVRYINVAKELTGRKDADEVRKGLDSLTISYPSSKAVDLCFATNMISVGLDVGRLGLMVVEGQPKTTAEYIQASSRVGRGKAKGIVFVVYSATKPRDRSHYENFAMYHNGFYQNVEPSSVTSFCRQVRDRALFGTLIGIYRSVDEEDSEAFRSPEERAFSLAAETILSRIEKVDPHELAGAKQDIEAIRAIWQESDYDRWFELKPDNLDRPTPLMHPSGSKTSDAWSGGTFDVPTSMRSVDAQCKLRIVGSYGEYYEREAECNA